MPSAGTCLVTGGAGFIGTASSPGLLDAFDRVVALDSLHPQIHPDGAAAVPDGIELVVGDVSDPAVWDDLLPRVSPDVVVHLAAETGTAQSLTESSRHTIVNVVGTSQMCDALLRHHLVPRRVLLASSRAVYGEGLWRRGDGSVFSPGQRTAEVLAAGQWDFPDAQPLPMMAESTPTSPASVYGATKLAQENLLRAWTGAVGSELVIVRLQNVYGPGQSLFNAYTGILSLFCRMAREGRSIPLYEDGQIRRDFVLIDDVARAIVAAATLESAPVGSVPIDIGSGQFQTIALAADLIARSYGAPAPHVTGQYRQGDVRHGWADITRAERVLGWTPKYDLAAGIDRLVSWIDTQDVVPPSEG